MAANPRFSRSRLREIDASYVSICWTTQIQLGKRGFLLGKEPPIAIVFMRLRGLLGRAVAGIVPPKDIEDIVQETYVRACQARNKDARNAPRAFLFKIARNLALDYARKAETRLAVSASDVLDEAFRFATPLSNDTLEQAISDEEFSEFCRVVRALPTNQRRAFVLKKVYGFSQREIAAEMKISEKTVERHISLATKKCFDQLNAKVSRSATPDAMTEREGGTS